MCILSRCRPPQRRLPKQSATPIAATAGSLIAGPLSALGLAWQSLAGPFCLLRHGRAAYVVGDPLCRAQSRPCPSCRAPRSLAMVQRPRAFGTRRGSAHLIPDWQAYLDDLPASWQQDALRQSTGTGRPLGSVDFVRGLERQLDRKLQPKPPGRKKKARSQIRKVK